MKLSIVTTLYQSASYIEEFHSRASVVARQMVDDDYEIIMVNDGSPDNSLEVAVALTEQDKHLVVVDLSRNFGHHKAMMTGLMQSKGDKVFLIDVDLEEEPEWLIPFEDEMKTKKADVIFGVQGKRKGNWFERWSGHLFYKLFNVITGVNIPSNLVVARLMTRKYVNALIRHQEREIFMAGLWKITGFTQYGFTVKKLSTSQTTYTFRRKMSHVLNAITSFSNIPLKFIFYFGSFISFVASIYICNIIIAYMVSDSPVSGWASTIASIWFLGGLIIAFLGVLGVYLSKIFNEVKQRPYTIIKEIYGQSVR